MASKSMAGFLAYRRPLPGTQPNHLHPPYLSSVKRAPGKPLILFPNTLSEITGPVLVGMNRRKRLDLTRHHMGEPIGERIVVSGAGDR